MAAEANRRRRSARRWRPYSDRSAALTNEGRRKRGELTAGGGALAPAGRNSSSGGPKRGTREKNGTADGIDDIAAVKVEGRLRQFPSQPSPDRTT